MTVIFDPIWPWSLLWYALSRVPTALQGIALLAVIAAFLLPIFQLAQARSHWRASLASVVVLSLLLLSQHTWLPLFAYSMEANKQLINAFAATVVLHLWMFLLLVGPPALIGLSVGTYLGSSGLTRWRFVVLVTLRLLAFLLTMLAILRPSIGWTEAEQATTQLFLVLDHSRSMTTQDERGKQSRWELLTKTLEAAEPELTRLRARQVDVKWFRFAEELTEITPDDLGQPDGKRTDIGGALRALYDRRDERTSARGVLLLSDGADNGGTPALAEAMRWRGAGIPLHTFACGNPSTTPKQNDVAITSISTSPSPFVMIKGTLTVRLRVDARGYAGSRARVRLFLEDDGADREVLAQDVMLPETTDNEVTLTTRAPDKPGEVKVKAVIETPEPDDLPLNNVIETFITVSKEGIAVLLVDRTRAHEPQSIYDALARYAPRINVTPVWIRGGKAAPSRILDEQQFDVILLGDVSAAQLRSLDPQAIEKIEQQVRRGAGLMVLGGYVNLGNGNWQGTALEKLLPVDLSENEQFDKPVRMLPSEDGLIRARYILGLDDNPEVRSAWEKLARLDGMTVLKLPTTRSPLDAVLAETEDKRPLLVTRTYGTKGEAASRVLVFGGDTTYRWIRDEKSQQLHERFWRQVVIWLARQEDAEGSVWIKPDVRRLRVGSELGFSVGLRGKGGGPDLREGVFSVELTDPDGVKSIVPILQSATQNRGTVTETKKPGIYRLTVRGEGKDPSGGVISGESSARIIVYDDDLELTRPAADPEFLRKLAVAGGGEALRVEELVDFLARLANEPTDQVGQSIEWYPDWRTTRRSNFFVLFFLIFCAIVSLEWGLRRRWGLV